MGRNRIENKRENLINTHGQEFVDAMETLKTSHWASCQGIATKYGFSRQHIGNIFKQLNGTTYSIYRKKKIEKITAENVDCKYDPRQKLVRSSGSGKRTEIAEMQIKFMEKCQEYGFDIKVSSNMLISLYVNNYAVRVPVSKHQGKAQYSAFAIQPSKFKFIDFYAPYIAYHDAFFIIPTEKFADLSLAQEHQSVYIRNKFSKYHNAKNKYMEYMNNFDPFQTKNTREKSHD